MENTMKPTIETGAMTLLLLVKYYKNQMRALLQKNGVLVPRGASDQQIAMLMANLLKISKSFYIDLKNFLRNPKVVQTLAQGIKGNAEYFRMSGRGYMNVQGVDEEGTNNLFGFPTTTSNTSTTTETKDDKKGFFSDINLGNLLSQGLDAFASYDKNKTDRAIAEAKARLNRALTPEEIVEIEEKVEEDEKKKDGTSTTTIVVLSLVGIAVIGTIIYFVTRPKN